MASRSSKSTHSPNAAMTKPSERSRTERPRQTPQARSGMGPSTRGPTEKKHQNLAEVELRGRQSDRGGGRQGTRGR